MLCLINIAISLCNAALEWEPKPSTLESGIRRDVRNNIRPALNDVRIALEAHLSLLEQKEQNKRQAEELDRAQKRTKLIRKKAWDDMQADLVSDPPTTREIPPASRPSREHDVFDVDELEVEVRHHSTGVRATKPRPQVARQATEEIPAPDPAVIWTEQEECVLLNGLQHFTGADRYSRILEAATVLNMKDIDQCIAQAQYYKQACSKMLADSLAQSSPSYDWLRSV